MAFKAYSIIDIYSRKIVGWRVEEREVDELAVEMFQDAFAEHGIPEAVHADSGPAMRSTLLKDLLGDLGVTQTHNRPRVSNDNPFSESEFRTMKYRPNYPGTFTDIEPPAPTWPGTCPGTTSTTSIPASRCSHPNQVHDGTWRTLWRQRDQAQQAYYDAHPETVPPPPHDPQARTARRHQPAQTRTRHRTTPRSLTQPDSPEPSPGSPTP